MEYRFGKSIKHREAQVNHFKRNKAIQYLQNKSFRRDVLIMFNNNNGRYRKIKLGKKLKLITFEGHEIKGRLIKLNDSSIVLNNRNIPSEVPIKNIKCLYSNKTILNNLVEGVIIFFAAGFTSANYLLAPISLPVTAYKIAHFHRRKFDSKKYKYMIFK